ncbi:hypothetical protein N320_01372, partial [Buceros rhinoceros silvestris]
NTTGKLWATGQGGETQTIHSDLTPSPTTIVGSPHSEIHAASQGPSFASSGNILGKKAVKKTSNPTTPTAASQSNVHSDGNPDEDKMGSLSSSKGTSLQSNTRDIPLQHEVTTSRDTATESRPLEQSSHSTGITSTQQDASSKASGFETT